MVRGGGAAVKALGTLLLLMGGLWVRQSLLQRHRERIQAGEELIAALQILERGVYTLRRPMGELVEQCRATGRLTAPFWGAVGRGMAAGDSFQRAWQTEVNRLPEPYGTLLLPLWQTLPAGTGADLLHQVREDVYQAVGQARQESGERSKLVTALCLSASLLTAVVLL